MCIKSSNSKGDHLLVSCGNEDDPTVKFWDLKDQTSIGKWCRSQDSEKPPYYYLNVVWLDSDSVYEKDLFQGYDQMEEEVKVKRGFVVFVASIRGIDVYMKNPNTNECDFYNELSHEDIGSYLSPMTTIMHDTNTLTLLVGNVNGMVEQYTYKFDSQESEESSEEIDSKEIDAVESNNSKTGFKKNSENRIKIASDVDIKILIERHRREGKFTVESEDHESNSHPHEYNLGESQDSGINGQIGERPKPSDENEPDSPLAPKSIIEDELNGKHSIGKDPQGFEDISGINLNEDDLKVDSIEDKL